MTSKALLAIIIVACLVRFVGLGVSPPGFFYDEATGAAHAICYQQSGYDLHGKRALFSAVDFNGVQTAPYLMGSALWTTVAGTGPGGFRSFVAAISVLTIAGIYLLAHALCRNREQALWTTALAACLPWSFQFSRIAWDAPLGVAFLVWGLALIYRAPRQAGGEGKEPVEAWQWVTAGAVLLTLASYTYSPLRLQAGMLVLLLPFVSWRTRGIVISIFTLGNIAVLLAYRDPEFASRAQLLALTSDDIRNPYRDAGLGGMLLGFLQQFAAHFSPRFLLLSGDGNLRHSIQTHGMLDWLTFAGLCLGLGLAARQLLRFKHENRAALQLPTLALLGIVTGITPAALTWDSIPHALRAIGAWPFIALLAAYGITRVARSSRLQLACVALMAVLFTRYLYDYFTHYPEIAGWWYDVEIREQILAEREFPERYLPVARAYYRMAEFGETCDFVRTSTVVWP